MQQFLRDAAGLGILFWLAGYLLSFVLFFTPVAGIMGWVLFAVMTPVTLAVTLWYFSHRPRPFPYFVKIGIAWTAIAIVFDYLFIVMLLHPAAYYRADVFTYYAVTCLIPVAVGWYLQEKQAAVA